MKEFDPYAVKFYGLNPRTGLPVTVIFNEPSPGRTTLMNLNPLLKSWMFSEDAGLTWKKVDYFADYIDRVDCLLETL